MQRVSARGAEIPALGFGTWKLQGRSCAERVSDALSLGYRHVDTAQMYENHERVRDGLREADVDREEIFLTTKLGVDNVARGDVLSSTDRSLSELGTDYVDLLLIHWPSEEVELEETLDAMLELREKGRVRHVGVSNFPPSWLEQADELAPVVCDQVEYHPLLSQAPLLEEVRSREMALVAYSPLAHGRALEQTALQEIARAHGRSPAQVALRWLVQQDRVCAIPKAGRREHLEENFRIFDFELEPEEMERLRGLAQHEDHRVIDPAFAPAWER